MSLEALRKALRTEKIYYGSTTAIKRLKMGATKCIFLSSTCPDVTREDILYYAKLANVDVIELKQPSDELSLICKRGHLVNVVGY